MKIGLEPQVRKEVKPLCEKVSKAAMSVLQVVEALTGIFG